MIKAKPSISEEKAATALQQMGFVRMGGGWYNEVPVPGEGTASNYIPGPATAALALVMQAETDRRPD